MIVLPATIPSILFFVFFGTRSAHLQKSFHFSVEREEQEIEILDKLDTVLTNKRHVYNQHASRDLLNLLGFLFRPAIFGRVNVNKESVKQFAKVYEKKNILKNLF